MQNKIINNNCTYNIAIDNFDGPLDLLLHLINKNKMSIFDISINDITDKYIEYLNDMSNLNLDIASEFIVMAATLLDIKSRKLIPEIEDEEDIISEEEIIDRIIEYKKYKDISMQINSMYLNNFGLFSKPMEKINFSQNNVYSGESIDVNKLKIIYMSLISKNQNSINSNAKEVEKLAIYEKITVKDKVNQIISYLKKSKCIVFNETFSIKKMTNLEVVTAFLGALELSKLKRINMTQDKLFSNINITKSDEKFEKFDLSSIVE